MKQLMWKNLPIGRLAIAAAALLLGGWCVLAPVSAQDQDKPTGDKTAAKDKSRKEKEEDKDDESEKKGNRGTIETSNPPEKDGHDRPTSYPRIRFGSKKGDDDGNKGEDAEEEVKSRVYLLDVSDAMSKSITVDKSRETTRLDHMIAQIDRSLKALAERADPRLRFNIVTFGVVDDFAGGGELQSATPATVKRARKWLTNLKARGESDMYGMLKECFEQEPNSATMIVGAKPTWPDSIGEEEQAKHADAGEYLLAEVKKWREDAKKTTLDITGVGLSAKEIKYFKRLAETAGGTYLDA